MPTIHKWTSKELLERRPSDQARIHPALLEFALRTAQDLSLDEDERTRIFLRMMQRQIRDEPCGDRDSFIEGASGII